jgi:TRAP-type C4-dicarboxylate transport system permease small subunit
MSEPRPASGIAAAIDGVILAVARGLAALAAVACGGIFILVLLAVVMRYVAQAPFRFTDELSGLLLAMSVVLAIPFTLATHQNIRVTLLTERLKPRAARLFWIAGQAILAVFCGLVAWDAWKITAFTLRLGLKSENARLELGPWLITFTGAFVLCTAIAAWQLLRPPSSGPKTIL